jgi:hypothetical protein
VGELALKLKKSGKRAEKEARRDEGHREPTEHDRKALKTIQREAKNAGATLKSGGKGGLPSILVLHIFRRDEYRCHRCGKQNNLSIHHKGGIVESKWLDKKGHKNDLNNFAVICDSCHDDVHEEARAHGDDSSQVLPSGDVGTKRDHGDKPRANTDKT